MKKTNLVLFPVLAALLLAGCTGTRKPRKKKSSSEVPVSSSVTPTPTSGVTPTSQTPTPTSQTPTPTSMTPVPVGDLIATVTLTGCADLDKSGVTDEQGVFSKGGATVTVTKGQCAQSVNDAVKATKTYEFRVYAKMDLTFSCGLDFSKLVIKYSTYKTDSGTTYYFDYDSIEGATNVHDDTKGEATVTLNSKSKTLSVNCYHQTRIASVAFYA